jgi:hypothetical protein
MTAGQNCSDIFNVTVHRIDLEIGGQHIFALAGEVTSTATGKHTLLGCGEADPNDQWWLVVVD